MKQRKTTRLGRYVQFFNFTLLQRKTKLIKYDFFPYLSLAELVNFGCVFACAFDRRRRSRSAVYFFFLFLILLGSLTTWWTNRNKVRKPNALSLFFNAHTFLNTHRQIELPFFDGLTNKQQILKAKQIVLHCTNHPHTSVSYNHIAWAEHTVTFEVKKKKKQPVKREETEGEMKSNVEVRDDKKKEEWFNFK